MRGIEGRWRWLGRPTFLVAVAVLAANDHVLKGAFPGWWTGKLSDVAGLVVVGMAAAVLLDVPLGLLVAGVAFVALKTVPGAAELVGPLLGGTTRRDLTDLVAVAALVPLAAHLGHRPRLRVLSGFGAAAVPVAGAVAAVLTCSATSCNPDPAATRIVARGSSLYTEVSPGYGESRWARSEDGGDTWNSSEPPVELDQTLKTGPTRACTAAGTCFEVLDGRSIDRIEPDGTRASELTLSDEEHRAMADSCGWSLGILESIAVAESADGPHVVAGLGASGVEVRQVDGTWRPTPVLDVDPPEPPPSPAVKAAMLGVIALAPLVAVAIWLVGRRRWPSWKAGILWVCVGSVVVLVVAGVVSFETQDAATMTDAFVLIGQLVVYVLAIAVAKGRPLAAARPDGASALPPPPG